MPLQVTLVRHGKTNANTEGWLQGQVDTDLSEHGLSQAARCGERLKHAFYDHVYSSDLKRCKQTAAAILVHHPRNVTVNYIRDLREIDYGTLSRNPLKYMLDKAQEQGVSLDKLISLHGGESIATFRSRVESAWDFIIKDAQEKQYQSILVVTHGGPLKYMSSYWIDNEIRAVNEDLEVAPIDQENTAVTRIDVTDNIIHEFNSTSHL